MIYLCTNNHTHTLLAHVPPCGLMWVILGSRQVDDTQTIVVLQCTKDP